MLPKRLMCLLLAAVLLSGCSGAGPIRIAAAQKAATPIAVYPPVDQYICQASIELEVGDVDIAAAQSARLAGDFGGYVSDSSVWYYSGEKLASLILNVPAYNFEGLRSALIGLGKLSNEKVSGNPAAPVYKYGNTQYSQIALTLKSKADVFISPAPAGWNPLQTLRRAFSVFLSIFGFILDILIWVVVVGGPFILIGLVVWWILRRRRAAHSLNEKVDSA